MKESSAYCFGVLKDLRNFAPLKSQLLGKKSSKSWEFSEVSQGMHVIKYLGSGAFSDVYLAELGEGPEKKSVAVKVRGGNQRPWGLADSPPSASFSDFFEASSRKKRLSH